MTKFEFKFTYYRKTFRPINLNTISKINVSNTCMVKMYEISRNLYDLDPVIKT